MTTAVQPRQRTQVSPWKPLLVRQYRLLWIAQFGSNIGTWAQTLGAQWLVAGHGSALVGVVQTATALPMFLLVLPAGAVADLLDRRRLLLVAQLVMLVVAGALALLTLVGGLSTISLLAFTFLLGCGQAMMAPAWQAIQPELVPRDLISQAAALNTTSVNLARIVGPAIGGLLVAVAGAGWTFGLNAVSFVGAVVVLTLWRRPADLTPSRTSGLFRALAEGISYVRRSSPARRVLLRVLLFVPASCVIWPYLPVVARQHFGWGSAGYGVLVGAFGLGATIGALVLPHVRARYGPNELLMLAGTGFAVALLVVGFVPLAAVVMPALIVAGMCTLTALSTFNTSMQLLLPDSMRARGLAVYQLIFHGGMAVASPLWGWLGDWLGVAAGCVLAAGLLGLGAASVRWSSLATLDSPRSV
ncbi:MFS transporter [Fodinicola feengrottensis]|uniref:MFS transporter n=1 Tax=Fodinicola feengrottensis TaxID=435914 RepID=A0ABN2GCQ6_9ACTN